MGSSDFSSRRAVCVPFRAASESVLKTPSWQTRNFHLEIPGETSITAGTRECTWRVAFVMRAHHLEKPRENTARTEENTFQDHEAIVVERKRVGHIISSDG